MDATGGGAGAASGWMTETGIKGFYANKFPQRVCGGTRKTLLKVLINLEPCRRSLVAVAAVTLLGVWVWADMTTLGGSIDAKGQTEHVRGPLRKQKKDQLRKR